MAFRMTSRLGLLIVIMHVPAAVALFWVAASTTGSVRAVSLLVGLGVSLGALVLAFVARRHAIETRMIGDAASRFAVGDLAFRSDRPASDDMAEIADALNAMATDLGGRIADIESRSRQQRAVLECMANGVIAIDPEQRITNLNRSAERLLGLEPDRAPGHLLQGVVRQPELHRLVGEAINGQEPGAVEVRLTGTPRLTVQAMAEVIRTQTGELHGVVLVLNDVTDIRRLESMRSDFAANVSHELRTPITNIKGYVETLLELDLDDDGDREQAQRFLHTVRKSANRLTAIVEDTMALTKLEQIGARKDLELEPILVLDLFRTAKALQAAAGRDKQISITLEAPEDLTINVQASMLEQAVSNLLGNAIAYSPPETTVRLRGSVVAGEVHLEVIDQGPGIDAEHHDRVFERFYRIDRARSREAGGTGLGLAIVKHIAGVHGGRAELDSEVGSGSTFRIVLPLQP